MVLTGGSAFGLAAADGVMQPCTPTGVGYPVGGAGEVVPIVPAAVIFDLGRGGDFASRPDATFGDEAYDEAALAATGAEAVRQGVVGAGTGAECGGLKGGIGSASAVLADGTTVAALVVVNPFGSTVDPETGELYAARFGLDGEFPALTAPSAEDVRAARDRALTLPGPVAASHPVLATTIGVIATDATLTKAQCAEGRRHRPRRHGAGDQTRCTRCSTGTRCSPWRPARARRRAAPQLHGAARRRRRLRHPGHRSRRPGGRDGADPGPAVAVLPRRVPLRVPRCHNGFRRRRARVSGQFTPQWPDGLPVGDEWVPAPQRADIRFPYDGSLVASAPVGDAATARRALDHAVALRDSVSRLPSHVRRAALSGAHRALAARRTEVEQLLVLETGKPLVDCRTEVDRTLLTLADLRARRWRGCTVRPCRWTCCPAGRG